MLYTYEQLDCALGSEFISEISPNRPELRPDTYLPSPYYFWLTIQNTANRKVRNLFHLLAAFISFSEQALFRCEFIGRVSNRRPLREQV